MKPDLFNLLPDVVLFVAVTRAKSFSRAAKALGMPVSTLSRRLSDFEAKLGVQLLVRSTRQLEPTEAGARYFERCQPLLEAAEAAHAELHGQSENPSGPLRVSVTPDFAVTYLTPLFQEFSALHPEISFQLDLTPRSVDLIAEGFDVAIRMGELPDSQLFARRLGNSPLALFAAPSYLKRASPLEAPEDLAHHECLRISGPLGGETRWTLQRGDQINVVWVKGHFIANSMRFILELATLGLGIAAIDNAIARPTVVNGRLVRVLPDWSPPPVPIHALTPSKFLPARTRLFLDRLAEYIRTEGPGEEAPLRRGGPPASPQTSARIRSAR